MAIYYGLSSFIDVRDINIRVNSSFYKNKQKKKLTVVTGLVDLSRKTVVEFAGCR